MGPPHAAQVGIVVAAALHVLIVADNDAASDDLAHASLREDDVAGLHVVDELP